jgi:hypothetical protein
VTDNLSRVDHLECVTRDKLSVPGLTLIMRAHLYVTAGTFLLAGALLAGAALLAPSLFNEAAEGAAGAGDEEAAIGAAILEITGRAITIAGAALSLPCLICGAGILARRGWSRWIGIPLAAVALVQFPVGTVMGAYLMWVLLATRFEPWFDRESA